MNHEFDLEIFRRATLSSNVVKPASAPDASSWLPRAMQLQQALSSTSCGHPGRLPSSLLSLLHTTWLRRAHERQNFPARTLIRLASSQYALTLLKQCHSPSDTHTASHPAVTFADEII